MQPMEVRERILEMAEDDYRKFHQNLCPGTDNILGVRVPRLRALAKEAAKDGADAYLKNAWYEYYEEILLAGMVIGFAKGDIEQTLGYVEAFVPRIDNWAVCDVFCAGLKAVSKNKARVFAFLRPYLKSQNEFDVRFAVVLLMDYYVDEEYIGRLLEIYDGVKHEGYYVKMGVAWALSLCYVKFPDETTRYLNSNNLDDWTYNKALQKIIESNRVEKEQKDLIRGMKRKKA